MTNAFADLGVPTSLLSVLDADGITTPTPIQAATLPDSLKGRDVLGRGRTGSGKTYAFGIPLVARLAGDNRKRPVAKYPRALVLAPTRELATQISATVTPLAKAAGLSTTLVFGGVAQGPQVTALRNGVDILIACPGRLEDLIKQDHCRLDHVQVTVLDEADHMADLGFLPVVRRLLDQTPKGGQRMLFSATLDNAIDVLVKRFLQNPAIHEADSAQSPVAKMDHHVLHIDKDLRLPVLVDLTSAPGRTVVFTRTKYGAKALARQLNKNGVPAVDLHGNLSQGARTRNLDAFHTGRAAVMVATDIAARGIHVDDVSLVVHADPPAEHKAYLHRSGRTARAGAAGTVITLMTSDQRGDVRALTKAAGITPTTTRIDNSSHPVLVELAPGERSRPGGLDLAPEGSQGSQRAAGSGRSGGARKPKAGQAAKSGKPGNGGGSGRAGKAPRNGAQGGANGSRSGGRGQGGQGQGQGGQGGQSRGGQAKSGSANGNGGQRSGGARNGGRGRSGGQGGSGGSGGHSAASFSSGRR